jgi:hypothetical protein
MITCRNGSLSSQTANDQVPKVGSEPTDRPKERVGVLGNASQLGAAARVRASRPFSVGLVAPVLPSSGLHDPTSGRPDRGKPLKEWSCRLLDAREGRLRDPPAHEVPVELYGARAAHTSSRMCP